MGNPWDHIKASKKLIALNLCDDFLNDTPISFININDKRFKKRKGYKETSPYCRYEKYQHARTMKEAIYLGAKMDDLIFDFSKEYWKLVEEKDSGVEECKEIIEFLDQLDKPEIKKSTSDPCLCCPDDYDPDCGTKYGLCYVCDEEIGDGGYDYKDYPSKICKSCYDMPDPVDVKKIREIEKLNDGIMDENKKLKLENKKLENKIKDDRPMIVYQATEIDDEISNLMKQVDLKEIQKENKKLIEENKKLIEENEKLKDNDDIADLLEEIQELKEKLKKKKTPIAEWDPLKNQYK